MLENILYDLEKIYTAVKNYLPQYEKQAILTAGFVGLSAAGYGGNRLCKFMADFNNNTLIPKFFEGTELENAVRKLNPLIRNFDKLGLLIFIVPEILAGATGVEGYREMITDPLYWLLYISLYVGSFTGTFQDYRSAHPKKVP